MTSVPTHLFLPLASSVGYVAGVLLIKRSAAFGVGVWRTTFVSNVMMALVFAPLWWLGGQPLRAELWWQPVVSGTLFFLGQVGTFVALEKGDVSVATPVLGLKIILVAFFSALLLIDPVPLTWWVAAGLSTAAIGLLNRRPRGAGAGAKAGAGRNVGFTIAAAAGAALAFAITDVLVQKWAPAWGAGRYLPVMFGWVGVVSCSLIAKFNSPLRSVPRVAWPWLLAGAWFLAVQAGGMAYTLATFGDATAANIVYSSRGLWSVLAVWWIGHWFSNDEQALGGAVLRGRLWGAGLMLAAIGLVLV